MHRIGKKVGMKMDVLNTTRTSRDDVHCIGSEMFALKRIINDYP